MSEPEHVHGATRYTLKSGRVICSCGYERFETEQDLECWGLAGESIPDPELVALRQMVSLGEFAA